MVRVQSLSRRERDGAERQGEGSNDEMFAQLALTDFILSRRERAPAFKQNGRNGKFKLRHYPSKGELDLAQAQVNNRVAFKTAATWRYQMTRKLLGISVLGLGLLSASAPAFAHHAVSAEF